MPFKFSGEKPALQSADGAPTSFASFGSFATSTTSSFASTQPSLGTRAAPGLGLNSQTIPHPTPPSLSLPTTHGHDLIAEEARSLMDASQDEALPHGLQRLLTNRPAPFGDRERMVDCVLQEYLAAFDESEEEARQLLAQGLRCLRTSEETFAIRYLASFLMDEVVRLREAASPPRRVLPPSNMPEEQPTEQRTGETTPARDIKGMEERASSEHGLEDDQQSTTSDVETFRFMELPAELRVWVYRELLVPTGFVQGRNEDDIHTAILGTTKQIRHEARDLLYDNTFYLRMEIRLGTNTLFESGYVPIPCLSAVQKASVLLDLTHIHSTNHEVLDGVDWRQLQAMVGLKKVRLFTIHGASKYSRPECVAAILERVIQRIPKTCVVRYDKESSMDHDAQKHAIRMATHKGDRDPVEIDDRLLERCGKEAESMQGSKSGHMRGL